MSTLSPASVTKESRFSTGVLKVLETVDRIGNKLPHPFWIFVGLADRKSVV